MIGYGNELRGDDALGPVIARRLAESRLPGLEVLVCHQLTPELVTELEGRALVIFVDASARQEEAPIRLHEVRPQDGFALGHHYTPAMLLALAEALHVKTPPAYLMEVQGYGFEYGADITDGARQHIEAAEETLRRFLREAGCRA